MSSDSRQRLANFFYVLLRDRLPFGDVERILVDAAVLDARATDVDLVGVSPFLRGRIHPMHAGIVAHADRLATVVLGPQPPRYNGPTTLGFVAPIHGVEVSSIESGWIQERPIKSVKAKATRRPARLYYWRERDQASKRLIDFYDNSTGGTNTIVAGGAHPIVCGDVEIELGGIAKDTIFRTEQGSVTILVEYEGGS